jgi:hypothetical protein
MSSVSTGLRQRLWPASLSPHPERYIIHRNVPFAKGALAIASE